jgi:3-dehydroquinate synthase
MEAGLQMSGFESIQKGMSVRHSKGRYNLIFKTFAEVTFNESDFFILDSKLKGHLKLPEHRTLILEVDESTKTLETVSKCADWLSKCGANRTSRLVAVGGGAIQDIVTVLSSLYMRGIQWMLVPTTSNSMLDSCVGGKSAINTSNQKNLLGNFHPPQEVVIDVELLDSLDPVNYLGGIFEGVKIVFARDRARLLNYVTELDGKSYRLDNSLIAESLRCKISIVEEDEFDLGRRVLLNYGHTFGHALEHASNYLVSHGLGVGLGMLAANSFSQNLDQTRILDSAIWKMIRRLPNEILPKASQVDWVSFESSLIADKKGGHEFMGFVLVNATGELEFKKIARLQENVDKAVQSMKGVINELQEVS